MGCYVCAEHSFTAQISKGHLVGFHPDTVSLFTLKKCRSPRLLLYRLELLELSEFADLQLVPTINNQNPSEWCHGWLPSPRQSGVSLLSSNASDVEPAAHPEVSTVRLLRRLKESCGGGREVWKEKMYKYHWGEAIRCNACGFKEVLACRTSLLFISFKYSA